MANRLGKIYGTEEDKVNCNFYFKIGACRHGDKCNRIHNKPSISQTILFKHLYINPPTAIAIAEGNKVSDEALQEALKHFENFYEDIFLELAKYGELLECLCLLFFLLSSLSLLLSLCFLCCSLYSGCSAYI